MTSQFNLTQEERITKAKIQLGHFEKGKPFFNHLLGFATFKEDNNIPTMCVDVKGNMRYNKEWLSKLTDEELKGVLCHEVMHLALSTILRLGNRSPYEWNVASDLIINNILVNDKFELPEGLVPSKNAYINKDLGITIKDLDKKSAEIVYDEVKKELQNQPKNQSGNSQSGNNGNQQQQQDDEGDLKNFDIHDYSGVVDKEDDNSRNSNNKDNSKNTTPLSEKELQELEKEWKKRLVEALTQAKLCGNIPSGMDRLVNIHINNFVNWKTLLQKYISNNMKSDYTFSRPRKSSRALGIYLPSVIKENIEIYVAIDTSGSIDEKDISDFVGEMTSIARSVRNVKMTIIECDYKIHNVTEIDDNYNQHLRKIKARGGGGTSHIPIYKWIEENAKSPKVLINFTDGDSEFPKNPEKYNFKTLWVLGGEDVVDDDYIPFGDIIRLEQR